METTDFKNERSNRRINELLSDKERFNGSKTIDDYDFWLMITRPCGLSRGLVVLNIRIRT